MWPERNFGFVTTEEKLSLSLEFQVIMTRSTTDFNQLKFNSWRASEIFHSQGASKNNHSSST